MNRDEKAAETYLISQIRETKIYEPDGNIPPDFSLGSSIGVEVRRLNQNYFDGSTVEGLEQLDFSIHKSLRTVLTSYDKRYAGQSYWIGVQYERPFRGKTKKIKADMKKALDGFLEQGEHTPCSLHVNENVELTVFASRPVPNRIFRHAISSDDDSGGGVIQIYIDNITHCITEKTAKVKPHREGYCVWWLILVDNMGMGLIADETDEVKSALLSLGAFTRVIVINHSGTECLLDMRINSIVEK